jgi:Tfp pilus assembly protein PilE
MGQQQLLLIVLGVIVVGIAVVVGIQMFGEQSASSNLDSVVSDLQNLAARAHQYYSKPTQMGGGSRSFVGLTADTDGLSKLTTEGTNDNGTYSIVTAGNTAEVKLQGLGNQDGDGNGTNVTVWMWVRADVNDDSLTVEDR